MSRFLVRLLRVFLVGTGTMTMVMAVVNIVAAVQLIEPAEEASLGITRNEMIGWYIGPIVFGLLMVYVGLRPWKSKTDKTKQ